MSVDKESSAAGTDFEVNHEDAYDSDVDDEPNAAAAFMASLSSPGGPTGSNTCPIHEVQISPDNLFNNVSPLLSQEMQQQEHFDSDDDSVHDENMVPYDQYLATNEVQDVPSAASPAQPYIQVSLNELNDLRTQLDGYLKINQEQTLVNDTLQAELDRCKLEMQSLERNKVKHDLDMAIVSRNKRNAELEEENETLKTNLRNKEATIVDLTSETKTVLSEKKTLEDKYLEEIVCLKNANKVATGILQKFQMPTQTIPMLSKRPLSESYDLHKTGLGCTNPWYNKQARSTQPALYDGHVLLNPAHQPTRVHDSEETNAQAEASRAKMSQKPGHVTPVNYAKLNALYDQFVPQKELSHEQVY